MNKRIQQLVTRLNERLERAESDRDYLYADHNSHYGGYRLEQRNGTGFSRFTGTEARHTFKAFEAHLEGIHAALDLSWDNS